MAGFDCGCLTRRALAAVLARGPPPLAEIWGERVVDGPDVVGLVVCPGLWTEAVRGWEEGGSAVV